MSPKNGNTVAVERRVDLASLFCMIGRHGPAVAVAVIAMVTVLAGFIIYRTVKGKRRKATADGDDRTPGAERDASVQPSPEESHTSVEATDLSDDGLLDVKEDDDQTIRRRFASAPAEKASSPYYPPMMKDIQAPEHQYTSSDDTVGMAFVEPSYREVGQSLLSETDAEAEMVVEDSVYCYHITTNDITEDIMEEVHDRKGCLKEPDENRDEEEKVLLEEFQEAKVAIIDQDSSDRKNKQEDKSSHISENVGVEGVRAKEFPVKRNSMGYSLEEPVTCLEDAPVPCICNIKDEELVEENVDSVVFSSIGCYHLSTEEEKKAECEVAEEECEDYWLIPQQAVIHFSTSEQEINLLSTLQDQSHHATDEVVPLIQDYVDMSKEVSGKEQVTKLTAVDTDMPQLTESEEESEQKKTNGFTCSQEDVVPYDCDDQMKGNGLENDGIAACFEESWTLIVENNPDLCCLRAHIKAETKNDDLSGVITDAKTDIDTEDEVLRTATEDKVTDSTVLGSQMPSHDADSKPENTENDTTVAMTEKCTDLVGEPDVPYNTKDQQKIDDFESDAVIADTLVSISAAEEIPFPQLIGQDQQGDQMNGLNLDVTERTFAPNTAVCNDVCPNTLLIAQEMTSSDMSSSPQDQQKDHGKDSEAFDEVEIAASSYAPACNASLIEPSITVEKPHPDSVPHNQNQLGIDSENIETPDETRATSVSDTFACDKASIASATISEETSHEDMMSFCSDGLSNSVTDNEDFPGKTTGVATVAVDISSPMCPIYLPSFQQSELADNDLSSPGLGKESGISSMAVSPDLPDASNAFDMTIDNIVAPVRNCDLLFSAATESRYSLFATDVAVSYTNENKAAMVFGSYPPHSPKPSPSDADWINSESFAANEDMFGHEIEERYHREMDEFVAQIVDSVTCLAELKEATEMKAVEVVRIIEKKAEVGVEKKGESKEEEDEAVDFEKTDISIMEATMDNNEWITDSNYPVLPWMNLSAPIIAQDHTKPNKTYTEESSTETENSGLDTTDVPPATEVKESCTLSPLDENSESNRKVLAVQPMPQNVNVTFRVHYFPQSPYQTVAVTGNQQELGNWREFIPLERAKDGHWAIVVSLPAESHVEWKFVLLDKGEVCRWEECGNRLLETGSGDDLLVHKWWGFL